VTPPVPKQALAHVHPDPNELGRVYQPQLAIACGVCDFANALVNIELAPRGHAGWLREARAAYVKFSTPPSPAAASRFVDLAAVMGWLSEHLKEDAIMCNGAGNYTVWVHRFFRYRRPHTELAPISGKCPPSGLVA
jgi:acetolactate synthase-1/2/3 large subunit